MNRLPLLLIFITSFFAQAQKAPLKKRFALPQVDLLSSIKNISQKEITENLKAMIDPETNTLKSEDILAQLSLKTATIDKKCQEILLTLCRSYDKGLPLDIEYGRFAGPCTQFYIQLNQSLIESSLKEEIKRELCSELVNQLIPTGKELTQTWHEQQTK